MNFKSNLILILACFFFSNIILPKSVQNQLNHIDIRKNKEITSNYEILVEVLRGAGLSFEDAILASKSFKEAYPPDRLSEKSYLIMPPIGREIKTFAINVDDVEAVIITKFNENFISYITSSKNAKEIISGYADGLSNIDTILPIDKASIPKNDNLDELRQIEIIFDKGSTLLGLLYSNHNKKKEIRNAVSQFKKIYKPNSIKIGTRGKIYKSNKNELVAFYIQINNSKLASVFSSPTGYTSEIINRKKFNEKIKKLQPKTENVQRKLEITRISLFNADYLKIKEITVKKGTNLFLILKENKISSSLINKIIKEIEKYFDTSKVKIGQKVKIVFDKTDFFGFSIKLNNINELQLIKSKNDFRVYLYEKAYKKKIGYTKIIIDRNLYLDSKKAKLPTEIFIDMVKLYSYSIDFQRDIRAGTFFEVMYENFYDYKNNFIMPGEIIYSRGVLFNKKLLEMFRFRLDQNIFEYFDANGNSIKKKLMRTPIDGARLSSGFGNRRHPILGYNKFHKGVDFAAKKGTPVYAAGDGKIERANIYGGYGKYIRIRHNSQYKTAYAHLYKFAKGIRKGKHVKQGSIIGFVGSTGRSTGPHLHYEIILNNKQVNPYKLKLPDGKKIPKELVEQFESEKEKILKELKLFNDS